MTDPKGFLKTNHNGNGLIIDEIQYAPNLLSYIQTMVDESQKPGEFILTGSQNFLINEKISQTLAGRIFLATLLPFSIDELINHNLFSSNIDKTIFFGFYPRIIAQKIPPEDWYPSYIRTYIERYIPSREFHTLEIRYTADQIKESHQAEAFASALIFLIHNRLETKLLLLCIQEFAVFF